MDCFSAKKINWDYIRTCDPKVIRETQDIQSLQTVLKNIMEAGFNDDDFETFAHPQLPRLLQLIQVIIDYLVSNCKKHSQRSRAKTVHLKRLVLKNRKLRRQKAILKESLKKFEAANAKASKIINHLKQPRNPCPLCEKVFVGSQYLEQHIASHHPDFLSLWHSLTNKTLPAQGNSKDAKTIEQLLSQIATLKDDLLKEQKTNAELDQKYQRLKSQIQNQELDVDVSELEASVKLWNEAQKKRKTKAILSYENTTVSFSKSEGVLDLTQKDLRSERIASVNSSNVQAVNNARKRMVIHNAQQFLNPEYQKEKYGINEKKMGNIITEITTEFKQEISKININELVEKALKEKHSEEKTKQTVPATKTDRMDNSSANKVTTTKVTKTSEPIKAQDPVHKSKSKPKQSVPPESESEDIEPPLLNNKPLNPNFTFTAKILKGNSKQQTVPNKGPFDVDSSSADEVYLDEEPVVKQVKPISIQQTNKTSPKVIIATQSEPQVKSNPKEVTVKSLPQKPNKNIKMNNLGLAESDLDSIFGPDSKNQKTTKKQTEKDAFEEEEMWLEEEEWGEEEEGWWEEEQWSEPKL